VIVAVRRGAASGCLGGEFSGNSALVKLGDQAMISDWNAPPLRLDPAEQIEQLVTIQAGHVELNQLVDRAGQLVEDMVDRRTSLDHIEHTYCISA
jgi:hypothetical protein